LGADGALIENRPSAPVRAWPNCCGLPALAAKSVTVELAIGAPPPSTWPAMFAAAAVVQDTALTRARIAAAQIASITRIAVLLSSEQDPLDQFRDDRCDHDLHVPFLSRLLLVERRDVRGPVVERGVQGERARRWGIRNRAARRAHDASFRLEVCDAAA